MPPAYAARQPPAEQGEKPVTVLVTGFGPFLAKFPRNTSWEIASTLPALIPVSPKNPTPIHVYVHHEAIRVAYDAVLNTVPAILPPSSQQYPAPDIVLHIGLAAGRNFFTLEEGSQGRGYGKIADVDNKRFPDEMAEEKFPSSEFPLKLETSFDTFDVLARWKAYLGYSSVEGDPAMEELPDLRPSPDAGNFMCGFVYYNSLAHYYALNKQERPVAFMHVPDLTSSEEKLQEGRDVAIALIKALVESRRKVGCTKGVPKDRQQITGEQVPLTDNNFA